MRRSLVRLPERQNEGRPVLIFIQPPSPSRRLRVCVRFRAADQHPLHSRATRGEAAALAAPPQGDARPSRPF